MEIWLKLTPGQGDEVGLVRLDNNGAFKSPKFVLRSLPRGENPMGFVLDLAKWMHVIARTVFEVDGSFVGQIQYDSHRTIR